MKKLPPLPPPADISASERVEKKSRERATAPTLPKIIVKRRTGVITDGAWAGLQHDKHVKSSSGAMEYYLSSHINSTDGPPPMVDTPPLPTPPVDGDLASTE